MRDFRSILNIIGVLLCIEAIAMLIPMCFDLYYNNLDWIQFLYASIVTFFIGIILYISFRKKNIKLGIRQAFVLTISSWIIISLFGAIPVIISSNNTNGLGWLTIVSPIFSIFVLLFLSGIPFAEGPNLKRWYELEDNGANWEQANYMACYAKICILWL